MLKSSNVAGFFYSSRLKNYVSNMLSFWQSKLNSEVSKFVGVTGKHIGWNILQIKLAGSRLSRKSGIL